MDSDHSDPADLQPDAGGLAHTGVPDQPQPDSGAPPAPPPDPDNNDAPPDGGGDAPDHTI